MLDVHVGDSDGAVNVERRTLWRHRISAKVVGMTNRDAGLKLTVEVARRIEEVGRMATEAERAEEATADADAWSDTEWSEAESDVVMTVTRPQAGGKRSRARQRTEEPGQTGNVTTQ